MNWDAVSAISQIVSGTAVFISLLYLAFQVRFARLAAATPLEPPELSASGKTSLQ